MSEPESLDTREPLARRIERHWFDRLIMLSDGVFAIAITLLALEVRPPEHWSGSFGDLIAQSWRALFGYGLSFVIVAFFWTSNRNIVARLCRVDTVYTALTLLLLCLIGLTPFAAALVAEHGPVRAMQSYSLFIAAAGVAQALLWAYAAFGRDLLYPEIDRRMRWFMLISLALFPILFAVAGTLFATPARAWAMAPVVLVAVAIGRARRRLLRSAG